jgi:hypothetical protein
MILRRSIGIGLFSVGLQVLMFAALLAHHH